MPHLGHVHYLEKATSWGKYGDHKPGNKAVPKLEKYDPLKAEKEAQELLMLEE